MKAGGIIVAAIAVLVVFVMARPSWSACCIEGCGNPPWTSCTANADCTGGYCGPPLGSAIAYDPDATCGEGAFSGCPATEAGECADGVNNDAWTGNTLTDCADPACAGDPHCLAPAPAMSRIGLVVMLVLLCMSGVAVVRRRRA